MYYVANITLKENAEIKEGLVSLPERINEIIGIGLIPYLDYDGNEVRPGMAFNLPTISIVNPNNEVLVEKRFDDYLFFKNYNLKDVIVNKSVKTS